MKFDFKTSWCATNFKVKHRELFERALKESGEHSLFIEENAYCLDGWSLPGYNALLCAVPGKNLSKFWDVYHRIEDEMGITFKDYL